MTNEQKQEWIAALRSGGYEQTTECLKDSTGYCCLGVLCDISGLGEWEGNLYIGADVDLPQSVQREYDLYPDGWHFPKTTVEKYTSIDLGSEPRDGYSLAALNDAGMTFGEIANMLEGSLDVKA